MLIPGRLKPLHFAARPRVVARYLGQVLVVLAALNVVPMLVALAGGQDGIAVRYLGVIAVLLAAGGAGTRLHPPPDIQRNEAMVISALAFVLPPFLFALPLMGYGLKYGDAFFEAVSGVTTTGLSVLPSVEALPFSFHFARAWMQWVGGLGVIVLCLAFLIEPGTATRHLGFDRREVDDLSGGTRAHARRGLLAYAALTVAGIGLLLALGLNAGDAVVHALAAISTGGFSRYDSSLAAFGSDAARFGVIVICLAGATPFYLYYRGRLRDWRAVLADAQFRTLLAATAIVAVTVSALTWAADPAPGWHTIEAAVLTAVSAQTTSGFSVVPIAGLDPATTAVLGAAMIVGGGFGSTAGGFKVLRLLILLRFMHLVLIRCSVPASTHIPSSLAGRTLEPREVEGAIAVVLGYVAVIFVSVLVFLAYGKPPTQSLFEVVSAIGTVGLSSGLSGPDLATPLKLVLCLDMLMGRVETVALIVLLFPPTWIGRRRIPS